CRTCNVVPTSTLSTCFAYTTLFRSVAYVLDDTKTKTRIVGFDRLRDVLDYANEHDMVYVSDPFSPFSMNNWLESAPDEAYTDGGHLHWVQHSLYAKDGFTEREWVAVLLAMRKQWPYCY